MKYKFLTIIFLLGLFLRMYQLGNVPVGFHRDEAFLGYNAYAILKTGKDAVNNFLPIHLESFMYSPAGYSYASIPFIAMFGLNEFSVRLASALFGSATIILTYFFVLKLFKTYAQRTLLATLSALTLAISPWHINLSRVTTDNVLVVFFITLGAFLFLHWIEKNRARYLLTSFVSFGITLAIYQAPRGFVPLVIPLLFVFFHKRPSLKKIILPLNFYIMIIVLPIILIITSHELSERIRMLSIFHHPQTQLALNEQIREEGSSANTLITKLFHNKLINYSSTFLQNYINHFSYDFLMTDAGLPARYRVPAMGLIYPADILFIAVGLIVLFKKHKKNAVLLTGWALLAPLGSGMTFDDIPNLQRTLMIFPALSIITAYGLLTLWQKATTFKFNQYIKAAIVITMTYNVLFYLHQYYVHQIVHQPWHRQEGYKELVSQINKISPKYKQVIVTDAEQTPEILFLFYLKTDPKEIQKKAENIVWTSHNIRFDKYKFGKICPLQTVNETDNMTGENKISLQAEKNTLYVNHASCKIPDKYIETLSEIKRSDGTIVFRIVVPKVNL